MTIVITGATGPLGHHIVESLLDRGTPAADIVAAGRNLAKVEDLAARGVRVEAIDFTDPATLDAAFKDADRVVLVSSSEVGQRFEQHRNVIDAAVRAGVSRLVYTSAPKATTSTLILAPEHKATEEYLVASGLTYTIVRNGWYTENYLPNLQAARATGELVAAVGEGRVASASRADFAEAAAVVVAGDGHDGAVYELAGDHAWDYNELAAGFGEVIDREVTYRAVNGEELVAILTGQGLDAQTAGFLAALDQNTAEGLLGDTTGDLSRLIGRPTTPLIDGLRAAV